MKLVRTCIALSMLIIPGLASTAKADQAGQIMEYDTSAAWYSNKTSGFTTDWDLYAFKGECSRYSKNNAEGQWVTAGGLDGLSGDYYHRMMIHGIECYHTLEAFEPWMNADGSPITTSPNYGSSVAASTLTFDNSLNSFGTLPKTTAYPQGWDWDPGYQKATCWTDNIVSGISQKTDGSGIDKVQCMRRPVHYYRDDQSCTVVTMGVNYNGHNHGSAPLDPVLKDWDTGYQKGLCNGFIAGISRNVPAWDSKYGGGLHAILCCGGYTDSNTP